jgi:phospholipid/cholesterol/gamma-HCH transport system substrate-binding protein
LNDKVEGAIAGLTALEAKLTSGNGLAPKLLNDGAMAQKVDETLKNLNEITASLKQGNGSVGKFVMGDEFLTKLSGVTSRTDSLITMLSDSRGSLAKFSRDPAVYDNLNTSILTMQESIKHLDSLFVDLKKNPGRYVHVSVF